MEHGVTRFCKSKKLKIQDSRFKQTLKKHVKIRDDDDDRKSAKREKGMKIAMMMMMMMMRRTCKLLKLCKIS